MLDKIKKAMESRLEFITQNPIESDSREIQDIWNLYWSMVGTENQTQK